MQSWWKKLPWCNNSTEKRSTVDSRRRVTNFKMLVDQCQQSWDSPSNYGQVLNQVLKVSAFGMGAGSHTPLIDCIIRDILLLPLPQVMCRLSYATYRLHYQRHTAATLATGQSATASGWLFHIPSSGKFTVALCPRSFSRLDSDLGY